MESPSDQQKKKMLSERLSDRVNTPRCQIGVLGLSLKLSRKIGDFPNDPVQGPLEIFGVQKDMFAPPSFWMEVQLHSLHPLFRHPCYHTKNVCDANNAFATNVSTNNHA